MHEHANARDNIDAMIRSGDLVGLLRQAEALHGHLCPFVSLGVKAGQYAMHRLNIGSTGMEEVVAIVECNNCFTDGIQVVTGCTFGNNALVFRDLGKTAVTVALRGSGKGLRLVVRPQYRDEMFARYPAAGPLFEKVLGPEKRHPGRGAPPASHLAGHCPQGAGAAPGGKPGGPGGEGHPPGLRPHLPHHRLFPMRRRRHGAPDQTGKGPAHLPDLRRP